MTTEDYSAAPCSGLNYFTEITNWKQAKTMLDVCAGCPMRLLCLETVNPMSNWSDGVVGGYLFLNGKPMTKELLKLHPLDRPYHDEESLEQYADKYNHKLD